MYMYVCIIHKIWELEDEGQEFCKTDCVLSDELRDGKMVKELEMCWVAQLRKYLLFIINSNLSFSKYRFHVEG